MKKFLQAPLHEKRAVLERRLVALYSGNRNVFRLPFGAYWLPEGSALDALLICGSFEAGEARFIGQFVKEGMTVLDIGAHHGLYTMLCSRRAGKTGRVIAFEPSPRERIRLKRHIRLNRCKNVSVQDFALGSSLGEAELYVVEGAQDFCNSLRPPSVDAETMKIEVRTISLDQFLSDADKKRINFVKIDTEGAEREVLAGATELFTTGSRPVVMCEIAEIRTAAWGYSARDNIRFMESLNYSWYSVGDSGLLSEIAEQIDLSDTNLVAVPAERKEGVLSRFGALAGGPRNQ